jgi:hypothetical protein
VRGVHELEDAVCGERRKFRQRKGNTFYCHFSSPFAAASDVDRVASGDGSSPGLAFLLVLLLAKGRRDGKKKEGKAFLGIVTRSPLLTPSKKVDATLKIHTLWYTRINYSI